MESNTLTPAKEDALLVRSSRILSTFLAIIGAWPGEALGQQKSWFSVCWRKYLVIQTALVIGGETYYLIDMFHSLSFFDLGNIYITNFLTVLAFARYIIANLGKYGEISRYFMMEFHLIHHKHKGAYYKKMYELVEKVSFYFSLYLSSIMVFGAALFNISPLYNNIKTGVFTGNVPENATLDFSVFYKYPGFEPTDHFYIVTLINILLSLICGVSVCTIDLFLSLMVFQIIGHIEILRNNLENLPLPAGQTSSCGQFKFEVYDRDENMMIHEKLKECVNYHKMIVKFTDDLSSFFGPTLAFYYLFHSVSCCLLLLECFRGELVALVRYGPLTIIVFGQLIQISVIFEVVNTVSVKLIDAVYGVPWEVMNVSNQRSVSIMLNRIQNPIQVTAMDMVPVGVQTMAGILKTTFSYFMLLRSMSE